MKIAELIEIVREFCGNKTERSNLVSKLENFLSCCGRIMKLESFLKIPQELETMSFDAEEKVGKQKPRSVSNGSGITHNAIDSFDYINAGKDFSSKPKTFSERFISRIDYTYEHGYALNIESSRYLDYDRESYGSMRKERDWKRTLGCKLFEERHSVDGGEGMDSLWEIYENESAKPMLKRDKNKKKKKAEFEKVKESEGLWRNLQAAKLSTGKNNLGMKRPNLVKISKVFKGIGWVSYVSKYSKKVHNNGDRY